MKSSTPTINPTEIESRDIQKLFTNITPRYDLLNTLLSFRLDEHWRARAVEQGLLGSPKSMLDIGTGTGKLLGAFIKKGNLRRACGLDLCESMLKKAQSEVAGRETSFTCANSLAVPFKNESFDLIVSSFTLRSIPDHRLFFSELFRVLSPGGRIVMLELTRPRSWWLRTAYVPYLRVYLPFLGWAISGDQNAYRFLAESISTFKEPSELIALMSGAGFSGGRAEALSFGLATLFTAEKPRA